MPILGAIMALLLLSPPASAQSVLRSPPVDGGTLSGWSLVTKARVVCRVYTEGNRRITRYCEDGYECLPDDKCGPGPEMRRQMERENEERRRAADEQIRRLREMQERVQAAANRARREAQKADRRAAEQRRYSSADNSKIVPSPRYDMGRYSPGWGRPAPGRNSDPRNIPSPQYGKARTPPPGVSRPPMRTAAPLRRVTRIVYEAPAARVPAVGSPTSPATSEPPANNVRPELFERPAPNAAPPPGSGSSRSMSPEEIEDVYIKGEEVKTLASLDDEKLDAAQREELKLIQSVIERSRKPDPPPARGVAPPPAPKPVSCRRATSDITGIKYSTPPPQPVVTQCKEAKSQLARARADRVKYPALSKEAYAKSAEIYRAVGDPIADRIVAEASAADAAPYIAADARIEKEDAALKEALDADRTAGLIEKGAVETNSCPSLQAAVDRHQEAAKAFSIAKVAGRAQASAQRAKYLSCVIDECERKRKLNQHRGKISLRTRLLLQRLEKSECKP